MSVTKKAKVRLSDLSMPELRDAYRNMKEQRDALRLQLREKSEQLEILQESEKQLTTENETLNLHNERLQATIEELTNQFEQAKDNNTKLIGVSAAMDNATTSFGEQIISRLDTIIGQLGGNLSSDENVFADDDDDDDSESDSGFVLHFPSKTNDTSDVSDDEDVESEDDEDSEDVHPETFEDAADALGLSSAIHGADVEDEEPAQVTSVSEDELTALVSDAIKTVVDSYPDYEDTILAGIRDGSINKEMALRTVVMIAYPQHPEMVDVILSAQSTRDAVYGIMGV